MDLAGLGTRDYRPIADYAIIGDTQTAALVARDGSIDWCCLPRFDSGAVFCRLLDRQRGGFFRIGPIGDFSVQRRYIDDTNVLESHFDTGSGTLRLTDFMAVERREERRAGVEAYHTHDVLRLIEGVSGAVDVEIVFKPTFDYARASTTVSLRADGAVASAGQEHMVLACPTPLQPAGDGVWRARWRVNAGMRAWVTLAYDSGSEPQAFSAHDAEGALARTLTFWRDWARQCSYRGPYRESVVRSALALKLLTFSPSGAIVAAPSASLPEAIGGARNWDYRYVWLRDAGLILYALQSIGFHEEADHFFDWLTELCIRCRHRLQPIYTICGEADLQEACLAHLEGYRGSRPVRIGNGAARQVQLDIYGHVLDAADLHFAAGRGLHERQWALLSELADRAAQRWREPDQGLWEVRSEPSHFLYSKLLCWVALDRALRLAPAATPAAVRERWRRTRAEIRTAIERRGYDAGLGAFTQAFDRPVLDASALAIPLVGFLPPSDPRVRATLARIQERLTVNGLVYRYRPEESDDGLPGGEGTFALCSFWLVDNLALAGRVDEAQSLFERLLGYANDVGLLAEEIEPATGRLLGNYPQGFTHLGLIEAAVNLAKAQAYGPETAPETQAERHVKARAAGARASGGG